MDLAKKRDEFDSTFMCIPCNRLAGLSGCSTGAHCLAFLWQIRFSFQSFSFQKKGPKRLALILRISQPSLSWLTTQRTRAVVTQGGLVSLPCAVLILSRPITVPHAFHGLVVLVVAMLSPHPLCFLPPPALCLFSGLPPHLSLSPPSTSALLSVSADFSPHIPLPFTTLVFRPHLQSPDVETT